MQSKPCEHLKLTDEQIKGLICEMTTDLHSFKEEMQSAFELLEEQIEFMEEKIYRLKRHFCPEKFHEVQVSMGDLTEMMARAYVINPNAGQLQRMFNPSQEEQNDSPA